jgi:hypothetical protein
VTESFEGKVCTRTFPIDVLDRSGGAEYQIPKGETYLGVQVTVDFTIKETGKSYEQNLFIGVQLSSAAQ